MNMKELLTKVSEAHSEIPAGKARAILKTAFEAIHAELDATKEGKVSSPLGTFQVILRTAKVEGQPDETKRRIVLRLSKPKADAEADAEAGADSAAE